LLLGLASGLGLVSLLCWAAAPAVGLLYVAAICAGVAGAGVDLGLQSVMISGIPSDDRAAVMAGWNSLTGIRGLAAPFVATGLVQAGVLSVTDALLACAVVTLVGVGMYVRAARATSASPIPALRRRLALVRASL
jgi:MFS family permease